MSKAEEKTTELMKKAKDFIPDGGYSEKELNLAFFMFIKGYYQAEKDIIGNVRSILNKIAYRNNGLDVNGDYCEQPYVELDAEFRKLLKEE